MNPLIFICALLLILLLPGVLFASSIKLFFNIDELNEMGICLGTLEMQLESCDLLIFFPEQLTVHLDEENPSLA